MEDAPVPVIAAIHGTALGGGLEVALCAHYRVSVASAKFGSAGSQPGSAAGCRRHAASAPSRRCAKGTRNDDDRAARQQRRGASGGLVDEVIAGDRARRAARCCSRVRQQEPLLRTCRSSAFATATTRWPRPRATISFLPTSARASPARPAASSPRSTTFSASKPLPTCHSTRV